MSYEPVTPLAMPPLEVADETFLIRSAQPGFGAPLAVNLNSLVIRGAEPVIVDTGTVANRQRWLDDVFGLVDPADVRWVIITHDDDDHVGNLARVLELCPDATLVVDWATNERLGASFSLPTARMRWLDDGQGLDVGDRTLQAVRPPVYDSPTTRGIHDPVTSLYWASDTFATPMPIDLVDRVDELPPPMWAEGMAMFHHHALAPWLTMVDREKYGREVAKVRALGAEVIVSAHSPVISGTAVDRALDHLATLPDTVPPPHPDQEALVEILAGGPSAG